MDVSELRWVLIIGGIALIAGIFLFGSPEKNKKRAASRQAAQRKRKRAKAGASRREPTDAEATADRLEPTLDAPPSRFEPDPAFDPPQGELAIEPGFGDGPTPAAKAPEPEGPPPDKILLLYLQARDNHSITGLELLDAALKSGLEFGDRDIFHRPMDGSGESVFCMANLAKPGHFDKSAWNTMETRGVTLFLTLPGPMGALDAWDAMLATARRLAELLHADLLDQTREAFTRQREGEIREELRAYERDQRPEA